MDQVEDHIARERDPVEALHLCRVLWHAWCWIHSLHLLRVIDTTPHEQLVKGVTDPDNSLGERGDFNGFQLPVVPSSRGSGPTSPNHARFLDDGLRHEACGGRLAGVVGPARLGVPVPSPPNVDHREKE